VFVIGRKTAASAAVFFRPYFSIDFLNGRSFACFFLMHVGRPAETEGMSNQP
jgi:hypothetical protein